MTSRPKGERVKDFKDFVTTVVKPRQIIEIMPNSITNYDYLFELLVFKFVIQRNHEVVYQE